MNNIFIGNLSFDATKEDLEKLFSEFGTVASAIVMKGKKGTSRGYGFVDMPDDIQRAAAIAQLEGKDFMGRPLAVSVVLPKSTLKSPEVKRIKREARGEAEEFPREKKRWDKDKKFAKPFTPSPPSKFWNKDQDTRSAKPWRKRERDEKPFKSAGYSKPWEKKESYSKPFNKFN